MLQIRATSDIVTHGIVVIFPSNYMAWPLNKELLLIKDFIDYDFP